MQGDRLYDALDYILNEASESELEVIRAAIKRRIEGSDIRGPMGMNPERLARETAASVRKQLGGSLEQIRETVMGFAAEVIRKNAPELPEEEVEKLLSTWVPSPAAETKSREPDSGVGRAGRKGGAKQLPGEMLLTMMGQFIAYSTETMSVSEQVRLNDEIPDWKRKYWEQFSPRLRKLISLYLAGGIDKDAFWERSCAELGIDPGAISKK